MFKYPGDKFMLFDDETGLPNDVVTSVMEDNQKNLWISTEKGVGIYDGKIRLSHHLKGVCHTILWMFFFRILVDLCGSVSIHRDHW
ncbi:MAG: two-component regulator propeller domain-containing protein [Bacteroidales bacterium]